MTVTISPSMKSIRTCDIYLVEYGLTKGYVLSYGVINSMRSVLLKITDEDGTVGWGEANPQPPFTVESAEDVIQVWREEFLPTLLAEQVPEPEYIDKLLDARRDDHLIAKGAITMALLDIKGKRLGVPAATFLGTPIHSSLPLLWGLSDQTAEEDIQIIDAKVAEGYTSFMLKMGQLPIKEEIARVKKLEQHYGDRVKLVADANTGWTAKEAKEFIDGVQRSTLVFIEQPIDKYDIDGMASLAKESSIPLSVDEALTGIDQAHAIVDKEAAKVFSIKSSKNGGPLRAKAISDLAQKSDVKIFMNSMLELGITQAASLQHGITLPNLLDMGHAYMSTRRVHGDPTNFASFVKDGIVRMPTAPGLGIEVDEEKVRAMTVKSFTCSK